MSHTNHNVKGLKIIIIGCGKVGATLVERLDKEGHEITIIDERQSKIAEITNMYDIMGVVGNGASYRVQKEAGIDDADLLIAVTGSDELNLLCCTMARSKGQCAAIARVRTPDYSNDIPVIRERLDLAMIINPEFEAAREASRILAIPTALEVSSFAHGQAELVKIKIPEDNTLHNMSVRDMNSKVGNILITAVERAGEVSIPSGNFVLQGGDIITFVGTRKQVRNFMKAIGFTAKQVKNTLIIGGGRSAFYLAKQLLRMGVKVKIIESDFARCEELSVLLPDAIIINGDGTNRELLMEEGIATAESVVPLTGIDEENIMLTLFAKKVSQGNAKVITKVNRITFTDVIDQLDLGSVLYPKYITSEAIIRYVRARQAASIDNNIETIYHLFEGRVEAIEFHVNQESSVTNIPLKDLKIKENILIGFITRKDTMLIPTGQDMIKVGDNVMVVTTNEGFRELQEIIVD